MTPAMGMSASASTATAIAITSAYATATSAAIATTTAAAAPAVASVPTARPEKASGASDALRMRSRGGPISTGGRLGGRAFFDP